MSTKEELIKELTPSEARAWRDGKLDGLRPGAIEIIKRIKSAPGADDQAVDISSSGIGMPTPEPDEPVISPPTGPAGLYEPPVDVSLPPELPGGGATAAALGVGRSASLGVTDPLIAGLMSVSGNKLSYPEAVRIIELYREQYPGASTIGEIGGAFVPGPVGFVERNVLGPAAFVGTRAAKKIPGVSSALSATKKALAPVRTVPGELGARIPYEAKEMAKSGVMALGSAAGPMLEAGVKGAGVVSIENAIRGLGGFDTSQDGAAAAGIFAGAMGGGLHLGKALSDKIGASAAERLERRYRDLYDALGETKTSKIETPAGVKESTIEFGIKGPAGGLGIGEKHYTSAPVFGITRSLEKVADVAQKIKDEIASSLGNYYHGISETLRNTKWTSAQKFALKKGLINKTAIANRVRERIGALSFEGGRSLTPADPEYKTIQKFLNDWISNEGTAIDGIYAIENAWKEAIRLDDLSRAHYEFGDVPAVLRWARGALSEELRESIKYRAHTAEAAKRNISYEDLMEELAANPARNTYEILNKEYSQASRLYDKVISHKYSGGAGDVAAGAAGGVFGAATGIADPLTGAVLSVAGRRVQRKIAPLALPIAKIQVDRLLSGDINALGKFKDVAIAAARRGPTAVAQFIDANIQNNEFQKVLKASMYTEYSDDQISGLVDEVHRFSSQGRLGNIMKAHMLWSLSAKGGKRLSLRDIELLDIIRDQDEQPPEAASPNVAPEVIPSSSPARQPMPVATPTPMPSAMPTPIPLPRPSGR